MRVIVDAMGGDNAPLEIVKGCAAAVGELGVEILLYGDRDKLDGIFDGTGLSREGITGIHAPDVIEMEDDPGISIRSKKNSSMVMALTALAAGEGDAFVTAGSTGAALAGATLIVKRIKGVKRAALAPLLPGKKGPVLLIDCGANVECKPEYLEQFGVMGSVYMDKIVGVKNPRVGLINIGTEPTKGGDLQREAHRLLGESKANFVGNIEPREIMMGACDVAVADGFTGNVVLKTIEGMAKFFTSALKDLFYESLVTKLSALGVKKGLARFKKTMDYKETGGAPFIGVSKPVIKAHGSSDARSFCSAIRQAKIYAESGMIEQIAEYYSVTSEKK